VIVAEIDRVKMQDEDERELAAEAMRAESAAQARAA
jgi:hypothetical protein